MFKIFENNPQIGMVMGYRKIRQDNLIKRISSKLANFIRAELLRDSAPDSGCGLKVLSREIFLSLPYFDHMHRYMPALVQRQGYEVIFTPIDHRSRLGGKSNYGFWDRLFVGMFDLLGVWWLTKRAARTEIKEIGV